MQTRKRSIDDSLLNNSSDEAEVERPHKRLNAGREMPLLPSIHTLFPSNQDPSPLLYQTPIEKSGHYSIEAWNSFRNDRQIHHGTAQAIHHSAEYKTPTQADQHSSTQSSVHFVMHIETVPAAAKDVQDTDDAEAEKASFETTNEEEFKKSLDYILPVRILAHKLGLNSNPEKGWRYRDIKRLLFDSIPDRQLEFIKTNARHKLLAERLPNRLTMEQFCKRLALLVFHFILRDGREPKFWVRENCRRDIIARVLTVSNPTFYSKISTPVAMYAHGLLGSTSKTIEEAINLSVAHNKA